jgi:hypothetical protein
MPITSETPIQLSVTQFFGGLATLVVAGAGIAWGMMAIGTEAIKNDVGNMRADLNSIRTSLETATAAFKNTDKDGVLRLGEAERRLADQIGGLRTELAGLRSDLTSTTKTMTTFRDQLGEFQKQMQVRQVSFNDPKVMQNFADALKKAGADGSKIVIVPIDPSTFGPR